MAVYLHYEADAGKEHTLKLELRHDEPVTVAHALAAFVHSCRAATGANLEAARAQLQTARGRLLERNWVLPCGEPARSDLFVVAAAGGDGSAAPDAAPPLSAAESDAIRASQARRGENSYYYSVNKNLGNTVAPTEPHVPKAVHVARPVVRGSTIATYAMIDGDAKVKVNIPLAGAKRLPANGIAIGFFDRSFKLAIRPDAGTELSLNIPLLLETIDQHACAVKVLDGRVVLHMTKREAGKMWYELRKTKGVGDTEFDTLVPYAGELVVVVAGGDGEALPEGSAPVCVPGPPR